MRKPWLKKIREISKSIANVKDVKIDISGLPTWMSGGRGGLWIRR